MIKRQTWLWLLGGTILMILVMRPSGSVLQNHATPGGIINLELAKDSTETQNVINAWANDINQDRDVIASAHKNIYLDFIFLALYSSLFAVAAIQLTGNAKPTLQWAGRWMLRFAVLAGLLDVIENIGMLQSLDGHITEGISRITYIASAGKWLLVILLVGFITAMLVRKWIRRKDRPESK